KMEQRASVRITIAALPLASFVAATSIARGAGVLKDRIVFARLVPSTIGQFVADADGHNERPLIPPDTRDYFFATVREVNRKLPATERIRVLASSVAIPGRAPAQAETPPRTSKQRRRWNHDRTTSDSTGPHLCGHRPRRSSPG